MDRPLRALVLDRLQGATAKYGLDGTELDIALEAALQAAHAAWPEIEIPDEVFVRFLAARLAGDEDAVTAIRGVRAADLYLACACARADAPAIAALETQYLAHIGPALTRVHATAEVTDEVKQILRARLLVSEPGGVPKIADYSGRGDLRSWLRAAAVRAGIRVMRRPKGQRDVTDEALRAFPSADQDLELDYLKKTYGAQFNLALAEAFASLPARDRNLLRQFFGHGLTVDEMSPLYRVHRATVARWVAKARDALVARTRDAMVARLGVAPSEVSSLLRLIRSGLEVSLRAMARPAGKPLA